MTFEQLKKYDEWRKKKVARKQDKQKTAGSPPAAEGPPKGPAEKGKP